MTANFSLRELTKSMTATRRDFIEQFNPSTEIIENLNALAENILQPLRDATGSPIIIDSGYRCERLNTYIGGAKNSQHLLGQAADIEDFTHGNEFLYKKILDLNLPFDQLINEFNFEWIHISFSNRNRRQQLKAYKLNGLTIYKQI